MFTLHKIHHLNHFKVAFSTFPTLCNHHLHLVPEHSHLPEWKHRARSQSLPIPHPQPLATTDPLSVSTEDLPVLDISQNRIVQRAVFCVWLRPPHAILPSSLRGGSGGGALLSTLQPASLCGWTILCFPARQLTLLTVFNIHKRTAPSAVSIHRSCFCLSENFSLGHCWAGGAVGVLGAPAPPPAPCSLTGAPPAAATLASPASLTRLSSSFFYSFSVGCAFPSCQGLTARTACASSLTGVGWGARNTFLPPGEALGADGSSGTTYPFQLPISAPFCLDTASPSSPRGPAR